ncbi:MAG: condensation domain-containing protein [Actinocrinis sp.]
MDRYSDIAVEYGGLEDWSGPATWGQRAIWYPIEWYAPHDHYFNLGRVLTLGSGLAPADLAAVVREAVVRHPALRTSFAAPDGSLRQTLHGTGTLRVRHFAAERAQAQTAARSLVDLSQRERFDQCDGPSVRALAFGSADRVYALGLVVSHLISDGGGMEVLIDDLRRLAAHRRRDPGRLPPRPDGRTPREQAEYEAGPMAQRRCAAALEQWRTLLEDAPAPLLPAVPTAAEGEPDRWREAFLDGPAVDLAARWLADRWHRTPGAVILAAFATRLSELTGQDPLALKVILGNRAAPAQRTAVGNFVQDGLVCLRTRGRTLAELAGKADAALLTAARHGHYDPVAMRDVVAQAGSEHGRVLELDSFFNDFMPAAATPDEQQVRELEPSPVRWDGRMAKQDSLMFLKLWPDKGYASVRLLADSRRLPLEQTEKLLTGLQELLLTGVSLLGGC